MHPATPLIPAIWSSSKHAGDVKIPHLDVGEQQQAPRIQMVGVRRRKEAKEWRSVARRRVGDGGDAEGRQQHVASTRPGIIVIDSFCSRSLAITIHKTWGAGGGVGYLHTSIHAAIWHYFSSSEEMPGALLICLLPLSWPLLYVFDKGLPITCPFLTLIPLLWGSA